MFSTGFAILAGFAVLALVATKALVSPIVSMQIGFGVERFAGDVLSMAGMIFAGCAVLDLVIWSIRNRKRV